EVKHERPIDRLLGQIRVGEVGPDAAVDAIGQPLQSIDFVIRGVASEDYVCGCLDTNSSLGRGVADRLDDGIESGVIFVDVDRYFREEPKTEIVVIIWLQADHRRLGRLVNIVVLGNESYVHMIQPPWNLDAAIDRIVDRAQGADAINV